MSRFLMLLNLLLVLLVLSRGELLDERVLEPDILSTTMSEEEGLLWDQTIWIEDLILRTNPWVDSSTAQELSELIVSYSLKYGHDPFLITSIIYEESRFAQEALSFKGAIGIMQILPTTAQLFEWEKENLKDLWTMEANIDFGCFYLCTLMEKYSLRRALIIYNGGFTGAGKYYADRVLRRTTKIKQEWRSRYDKRVPR
jgi:soluble lytic murein transglycosylase